MSDMNQQIDKLSTNLGLSPTEIARRKQFLQLTPEDAGRLRRVHDRLVSQYSRFADAFYAHLASFPALQPLLQSETQLARLKQVQGDYFNTLTAGDYGDAYVRDRLRVGLVHQRIGLEPNWYLGAYRKYVAEMHTMLWEILGDDPPEYLKTCDALLKVVNFDIGLALDTYFQADLEQIVEHKEYAERIVQVMPNGLMVVSANLLVLSMNPAMRDMLRLAADVSGEGLPLATLIRSSLLHEAAVEVLRTEAPQGRILVSIEREDAVGRLEFNLSAIRYRGATLLLVMAQDITDKLEVEAQLAQSEALYRLTFDHAAVGLAQTDQHARITKVNQKLCEILGYDKSELLGVRFPQLTHPDERLDARDLIERVLQGNLKNYSRERRYLHKDGQVIWTNVTVSCLHQVAAPLGLVVVLEDISVRKRMEAELIRLAGHDALTGLPNRVLLQESLGRALARARRQGLLVAVMYLDLDRFKQINDSLGHAAGDAVLTDVSRRLRTVIREADTVARLGGDEFVVVLEGLETDAVIANRAQAVLATLAAPLRYRDQELFTAASIGVAVFPRDGDDAESLLKHADVAMYRAKEAGRNNVQFYTEAMHTRSAQRLRIASGLRHAIERQELTLHYQPKVAAAPHRLVGVEALLRWQPAEGQIIGPDSFIPVAEESGLIVPIGEWVLRKACSQVAWWRERGHTDLRVSVNLSASQFKAQNVVDVVAQVLAECECPAQALELEITESLLMENPQRVSAALHELVDMGVRLSLDDFGTGYSSLSYLRDFPIHELKIDRSFIGDIQTDPSHAAIVQAIIRLAHSLGLTVVAEGVETAEQVRHLTREGCDSFQGYYFARPAPPAELAQWWQQWRGGGDSTPWERSDPW